MALVSLRQLPDHAAGRGHGVPAFGVDGLGQIHVIREGVQRTQGPVSLEATIQCRR